MTAVCHVANAFYLICISQSKEYNFKSVELCEGDVCYSLIF